MDIPNLGEASDVAETAVKRGKNLVPWLPDPEVCPNCGQYMDAVRVYDKQQAAFYPNGMAPAWECSECDIQLRRGPY